MAGGLLGVGDRAAGGHQVELAGFDDLLGAEAVAVQDLSVDEPGDGLQPGVRVRPDVQSAVLGDVGGAHVVGEAPGPDRTTSLARQGAAHPDPAHDRFPAVADLHAGRGRVAGVGLGGWGVDGADGATHQSTLLAVHLAERVGDQLDPGAVGVAEVDRHLAVDDVLDTGLVEPPTRCVPALGLDRDRHVVQPAEHLGVRPDVEAREVEEGEQVAVADVEEEVRRAGVVAVLDQLGQREPEHVLVEADGPLDVAADQRGVVQAAGGGRRTLPGRAQVLLADPLAAGPPARAGHGWSGRGRCRSSLSSGRREGVRVVDGGGVRCPSGRLPHVGTLQQPDQVRHGDRARVGHVRRGDGRRDLLDRVLCRAPAPTGRSGP